MNRDALEASRTSSESTGVRDKYSAKVEDKEEALCTVIVPTKYFEDVHQCLELDGQPLSDHVIAPELLLTALVATAHRKPSGCCIMLRARAAFVWGQSIAGDRVEGRVCGSSVLAHECIDKPVEWLRREGVLDLNPNESERTEETGTRYSVLYDEKVQ